MAPARPLSGLRALVTGASSGIGAALSTELAGQGVRVAGTGRDFDALRALGCLEVVVARDLAPPGAAAAVVADAAGALGGLDIVVSSAGSGWSGRYEDTPTEQLDLMVDLNLRASMHVARSAATHLFASPDGGRLVLVGSIAGLVGVAEEVAYGTTKAALRGLADGLRAEWSGPRFARSHPGAKPVSVALICPGPVDTPFFSRRNRPYDRSWPRPARVETVARAIVTAIEQRRNFVVVPSWLGIPARLNGAAPELFARLQKAQDHLPG